MFQLVLESLSTSSIAPVLELVPSTKCANSDAFFGSLPDAALSPEERNLREAIYDFFANWNAQQPHTLSVMLQHGYVCGAKWTLWRKSTSTTAHIAQHLDRIRNVRKARMAREG